MTEFKVNPTQTRRGLIILWAAAMTAFLGSISLLIWFLPGAIPIGHTSGVWTAMAHDFSLGILYRPVFDEFGYGGTRYMPLYFILHGYMMMMNPDPIITGFILSLAIVVFLDVGVYLLLREIGVRRMVALPLTFLPHASISFQLLTLEFRGDFLSTAFNIWGILFALQHFRNKSWFLLTLSSLSFLGALFTKFTTVQGIAAVLLYYFLQGRKKSAVFLTTLTGVLGITTLILLHVWSDGRMLSNFEACLFGGGSLIYFLKTPVWFVRVIVQDPFFLIILGLATLVAIKTASENLKTFPYVCFWVTFAATFLIFSSPGTDHNHLMDLMAASLLILGVQFLQSFTFARLYNLSFIAIVLGTLFTWIPGTISIKDHMEALGKQTRESVRYIGDRLGPNAKNLMSENPLVPVLLGQRAIAMDTFSLRITALKSPEIDRDFNRKLENHFFGAVILVDYSGAPLEDLEEAMWNHLSKGTYRFYGEVHFNKGFFDRLRKYYYLSFNKRPFVIYEPIKDQVHALDPTAPQG